MHIDASEFEDAFVGDDELLVHEGRLFLKNRLIYLFVEYFFKRHAILSVFLPECTKFEITIVANRQL